MRPAVLLLAAFSVQTSPALDTVLSRLDTYLTAYEPRLSQVIADEDMSQTRPARSRAATPFRHRLKSEVAFVRLPGNGAWLGYRSVKSVNGRSVNQSGERLLELLARGPDEQRRAATIARESARHNLGEPRTINVPTLPLEFLHPRNRARLTFTLLTIEHIGGRQVRHLTFEETQRPTLVRSPANGDLVSYGSAWIEEGSGRILQAEVRTYDPAVGKGAREAVIRVWFVEHRALGFLVPSRMQEIFAIDSDRGRSEAHYSNFRAFGTSARIVPQP
jgi:hypothetical protein